MTARVDGGVVIGVDGGGTKTDAVLVALDGTVVARAIGGPSNYQAVGRHAAEAVWSELLEATAGRMGAQPLSSCWGLAGCDRPRDEAILEAVLDKVDPAPESLRDLVNDTFLILGAASDDGAGVAVVSGTGSNCVGIGRDGRRDRIGGLAWEFGDDGSGTDIGREGLRSAFRGEDGRGPRTLLTDLIRDRYGLDRLDDVVDLFVFDSDDGVDESALTPLVFDAATLGDPVAVSLLEHAGRELALSANLLAARLFARADAFTLALGGSVLQLGTCPVMREVLIRDVQSQYPNARPVIPDAPPVLGAALLALENLRAARPDLDIPARPLLVRRFLDSLESA
jgi:N-acetylglucosamine kinase-like BadF-type ATPase